MSDEIANGTFSSDGNGNFSGTYVIMPNMIHKTFAGKFSSAIPAFVVPTSTVTYVTNLSGVSRILAGSVTGATKIDIKLDNGAVLGGNVQPPLDTGYTVMGQGTWSSSA
ncbi:hypothetical protein AX17_005334 [Amanita inopinata Kibby_2008]|nr:hypothetical protein AX17_005334 [Amanita inopinata Kibby_2008]